MSESAFTLTHSFVHLVVFFPVPRLGKHGTPILRGLKLFETTPTRRFQKPLSEKLQLLESPNYHENIKTHVMNRYDASTTFVFLVRSVLSLKNACDPKFCRYKPGIATEY